MDDLFGHLTIVYTALFLCMGMVLLFAHIPDDKRLTIYKSSRKVFSCAYLLLGVTGITDFLFPTGDERNYIIIYIMASVSLIHAWLNGYAYLLLQEPSEKSRRQFRRYGMLGLPLIILSGGVTMFFPALYSFGSYAIGLVYVGQILWMYCVNRLEYRANMKAMENYYDGTLRFSWMNRILNMTLILAFINLLNYYLPAFSLPLRILTIPFYFYFAIRILNYEHVFVYVDEARKEENTDTDRQEENSEKIEPAPATILLTKNGSSYSTKLIPLIDQWCESKGFCKESLTIKSVAIEMGTNHTYLSAYLNKELNYSFQQWLNKLRIEESKQIWTEYPDMTVEEIGRAVGFSQLYNFSRWFKQITGVSPHQWRKQLLSERSKV